MLLQTKFNQLVRQKKWWQAGEPVVVAFSGGGDSVALSSLILHLPDMLRPHLILAHVVHNLRSDQADENRLVRQFAHRYGLAVYEYDWYLESHPDKGLEAAAHDVRYRFFQRLLPQVGAKVLLTAHHANDLLESYLFRLVREGTIKGLPGLEEEVHQKWGKVCRPLLGITKADLVTYLHTQALTYIEDSTNYEDTTARNRLRHHVIPQLILENQQWVSHLQAQVNELSGLTSIGQRYVHGLLQQAPLEVTASGYQWQWPESLNFSAAEWCWLLPELMTQAVKVPSLSYRQIQQVAQWASLGKGHHQLDISDAWCLRQDYRCLAWFQPDLQLTPMPVTYTPWNLLTQATYQIEKWLLSQIDLNQPLVATLVLPKQLTQLTWRTLTTGDYFELAEGHHQTLRRFLINRKVPRNHRSTIKGLVVEHQILWIPRLYQIKLWNNKETVKIVYIYHQTN